MGVPLDACWSTSFTVPNKLLFLIVGPGEFLLIRVMLIVIKEHSEERVCSGICNG